MHTDAVSGGGAARPGRSYGWIKSPNGSRPPLGPPGVPLSVQRQQVWRDPNVYLRPNRILRDGVVVPGVQDRDARYIAVVLCKPDEIAIDGIVGSDSVWIGVGRWCGIVGIGMCHRVEGTNTRNKVFCKPDLPFVECQTPRPTARRDNPLPNEAL